MPTEKAPFLTSSVQPLILSPDGVRTARYEVTPEGINVRVEPAPAFGPASGVTAAASERDVLDRNKVMALGDVGIRGVRDLFWLDAGVLLSTGYEDLRDERYFGWIIDLQGGEARVVALPSNNVSLVVPVGLDGRPSVRRADAGGVEVLLSYRSVGTESPGLSWAWYHVPTGDLVDAAPYEELPSSLWREAVVSRHGEVDAVLLWNGTVCRRAAGGWVDVGVVGLAASESPAEVLQGVQTLLPRRHLVGAGPGLGVFAVDALAADARAPQVVPPLEHLAEGGVAMPSPTAARSESVQDLLLSRQSGGGEADLEGWVLRQCKERRLSALVQMTGSGSAPLPLFAHPFADVIASDVWVDEESGCPEAVAVDDLRPRAYGLTASGRSLLEALRQKVPEGVKLDGHAIRREDLEPKTVERRGSRWLVSYWHPVLDENVVLPAVVEANEVSWIGTEHVPVLGSQLDGTSLELRPRVEGHRLQLGPHEELPLYLLLPESQDPAALVVRVHDGPHQRDRWGADGQDAWLLSRGYGVLKVNFRGSSGFGGRWRDASDGVAAAGGFLDDVAMAVRWALEERRAVAGVDAASGPPPVAVVGSGFGGYAALQALLEHRDLFACGVAIGPAQSLAEWPRSYAPDAAARLGGVRAPAERWEELRDAPLLLVEYERDADGALFERMAPQGSDPREWPSALQYVQYVGDRLGGGGSRQSALDQYRRIDAFLFKHLSAIAGREALLREPFTYEVPFLAGCLFPQKAKGALSTHGRVTEGVIEELFKQRFPDDPDLPSLLKEAPQKTAGDGFGDRRSAGVPRTKRRRPGRRSALVAPASRMSVGEDGLIQITLSFPEPPEDLHVILTKVYLHVRAQGLGFTLLLPRKPVPGKEMRSYKLPDSSSWQIEVQGDPRVGAIENFNVWAASGRDDAVLRSLRPSDVSEAPLAPLEAEVVG